MTFTADIRPGVRSSEAALDGEQGVEQFLADLRVDAIDEPEPQDGAIGLDPPEVLDPDVGVLAGLEPTVGPLRAGRHDFDREQDVGSRQPHGSGVTSPFVTTRSGTRPLKSS